MELLGLWVQGPQKLNLEWSWSAHVLARCVEIQQWFQALVCLLCLVPTWKDGMEPNWPLFSRLCPMRWGCSPKWGSCGFQDLDLDFHDWDRSDRWNNGGTCGASSPFPHRGLWKSPRCISQCESSEILAVIGLQHLHYLQPLQPCRMMLHRKAMGLT